jgi:hypothetical protein
MKVDVRDNNLIVFLNKEKTSSIDVSSKENLEDYFKGLFSELNDVFNLNICGSYSVKVFLDNDYGAVLEIIKDDIDFFDYCDGSIDMNISISKCNKFIYKLIGDIGSLINKCNLFSYDGDIFLEPFNFDFFEYGILLENCLLIYGDDCSMIKNNSHCISSV